MIFCADGGVTGVNGAIAGGAALIWRDTAVVWAATPTFRAAFARYLAPVTRIRATELLAVAMTETAGVVTAFAVVGP